MKCYKLLIPTLFIVLVLGSCKTDKKLTNDKQTVTKSRSEFRIMFYNVENLFDTEDDPEKRDEEFLPEGSRYWSKYRYYNKLNNIYKVIVGVGEWDLPQIVGLSELENRKVLEDLISNTPLYKADYKIIHYESPDRRGIDVGMLYRTEYFTPILQKPIRVVWPKSMSTGTTRDILYVSGYTNANDTLHIFINHWPSRWGGQMETEEKRMYVANMVKKETDSIFRVNPNANIIIMGDLNDYPSDRSLLESLKTQTEFDDIKPKKLYNLSYYLEHEKKLGTHKYNGQWGILDQIIVSGGVLDTVSSIYSTLDDAHVYNADFLLEPDDKFTGKKVNRTYIGFKYHGGYSDHLPVYLDLRKKSD
jgi:endonuclease/exonuclease/phosphatase family metal-dependent hydrolase